MIVDSWWRPQQPNPVLRKRDGEERRGRMDGARNGSLPRDGPEYRPPAGPSVPRPPLRVARFAHRPPVAPEREYAMSTVCESSPGNRIQIDAPNVQPRMAVEIDQEPE